MPRWQRVYMTACAAVTAAAIVYLFADYGGWPRLIYLPYDRAWSWTSTPPDETAMGYVGLVIWATAAAIAVAALAWGITGRVGRSVSDRLLHLSGGWTLTAVAITGMYFTWNLWPF